MKKDRKALSTRKKVGIIMGVVMAVIALGAVVIIGMDRDFDAKRYVSVILDYTFQGKTEDTGELFEEDSLVEMENQYERNIAVFVEQNIIGGIELEAEMKDKYTALCRDIFKKMKYQVKGAEKVNADEYKVTVEYQTSNIFPVYKEAASQEVSNIMERVQRGEYQGESAQAIQIQMQHDVVNNNYELLKSAYENVEYGEKEKIVFKIKRDGNETFVLESTVFSEFLAKILNLNEIQD